jgi:hypothetical protein
MPSKRVRRPFIRPERRRTADVTVTRLPVVRCANCKQTMAHQPGKAQEVLTEHYRKKHPEILGE